VLVKQAFDNKSIGGRNVARPDEWLVPAILLAPQQRGLGLLGFFRQVRIGPDFREEGFRRHLVNPVRNDEALSEV
jgi:hypothetical protein